MRRVTIAQLMLVVVVLAVGFAALRTGTQTSLKVVHTLTLALLMIALVGSLARRRRRAPWVGFAVFGWVPYLLMNANLLNSTYANNFLGN
jgi:heme A synthase